MFWVRNSYGQGHEWNIDLELLDALMAEIAVVAPSGTIVTCNRKWRDTAFRGGLLPKRQGWNYIEECEVAMERGSTAAIGVLGGLRQVLAGTLPFFVGTYACPYARSLQIGDLLFGPGCRQSFVDIGERRNGALSG
jgi:hypothetical protein